MSHYKVYKNKNKTFVFSFCCGKLFIGVAKNSTPNSYEQAKTICDFKIAQKKVKYLRKKYEKLEKKIEKIRNPYFSALFSLKDAIKYLKSTEMKIKKDVVS